MIRLTEEAKNRLTVDQKEFISAISTWRGEIIYEAGFTIETHSRVFDMIYNNIFNCDYLSDLIMCNEQPIVNNITADYILKDYKDFTELESFVKSKIDSLHPMS